MTVGSVMIASIPGGSLSFNMHTIEWLLYPFIYRLGTPLLSICRCMKPKTYRIMCMRHIRIRIPDEVHSQGANRIGVLVYRKNPGLIGSELKLNHRYWDIPRSLVLARLGSTCMLKAKQEIHGRGKMVLLWS